MIGEIEDSIKVGETKSQFIAKLRTWVRIMKKNHQNLRLNNPNKIKLLENNS